MTASTPKRGWRLEPRAAALERFLERHQIWILAILSLVYFAGTMLRAHGKAFWYDEILTLLEARQPNLSAAMRALGDVDWMPPANHLTFYLWNKLAGSGEVAFRIPCIVAFWVFCLCLYRFARRRVSIFFALMALLLPYASAFQWYSYEARGYAFMLAFSGIALISWQAAHAGTERFWPLLGIAIGCSGAILFQYWAVLLYLPLAGAEAYRSLQLRRVDWPVWAAFSVGGVALAASWFLILHGLQSWSPNTGMHARLGELPRFYTTAFHVSYGFAIPLLILLAAWFAFGGRKEAPDGARAASIPGYEWVAAMILLIIPVAAISIALALPPHAFSPRYAAPAIAGYALLGSFLAARFAGKRSSIGLVCVGAALAPFLYFMTHPRFENPFRMAPGLQRHLKEGPVAVEDLMLFMKVWYYTPENLKPRLFFLSSDHIKGFVGTHFDEFSRLGVPVVPYRDFALPGKEFLFYTGRRSKLAKRVVAGGGTVETVVHSPQHSLMRAHIGAEPSPPHSVYFLKTDAPETAIGK